MNSGGERAMHEELIRRIERATGPDRAIDEAIACGVLGFSVENLLAFAPTQAPVLEYFDPGRRAMDSLEAMVPRYTGSIDAADGLFRRLLLPDNTGATWDSGSPRAGRASARATIPGLGVPSEFKVANSTALAIVLVTISIYARIILR